jgi:hypothetical protein
MSLAVIGATPAGAATATVEGTGSYDKLVVNNAAKKLVFKIYAPGGECDIKHLQVKFRDRDGTKYEMDGGCYPGAVWLISVVRGDAVIDCEGFALTFNDTNTVWTGSIPRSCLKKLGGPVKVTYSYVDDYTPNANEVPATKYVAQG